MMWSLYYAGELVMSEISEEHMDETADSVTRLIKDGGGWLVLHTPTEEGMTVARLRVDAGVAIAFVPETDNTLLMTRADGRETAIDLDRD